MSAESAFCLVLTLTNSRDRAGSWGSDLSMRDRRHVSSEAGMEARTGAAEGGQREGVNGSQFTSQD